MACPYEVEVKSEVRSWLAQRSDRDFGRAGFLAELLAEHAGDLGEPCTPPPGRQSPGAAGSSC
jgi:hypothetical protein